VGSLPRHPSSSCGRDAGAARSHPPRSPASSLGARGSQASTHPLPRPPGPGPDAGLLKVSSFPIVRLFPFPHWMNILHRHLDVSMPHRDQDFNRRTQQSDQAPSGGRVRTREASRREPSPCHPCPSPARGEGEEKGGRREFSNFSGKQSHQVILNQLVNRKKAPKQSQFTALSARLRGLGAKANPISASLVAAPARPYRSQTYRTS